jgi:hypothetical protein
MDLDLRLKRALDRVELVSGSIGDPGQGRMCLMSLVAFLAGEPHSDAPGCASPVVQAFAVAVNDHMPGAARQRLKPFAPRIIGTRDGFDRVRAAILRRALAEEIPPEAPGRGPTGHGAPAEGGFAKLRRLWRWLREDERGRLLDRALSRDDGVYLATGGGAPDRAGGAPRPVCPRAGAALGRGHRAAGPAVRRGRAGGAARAGRAGRAPGAARGHAPAARPDGRRASPRCASSCEARRDAPAKMLDVR